MWTLGSMVRLPNDWVSTTTSVGTNHYIDDTLRLYTLPLILGPQDEENGPKWTDDVERRFLSYDSETPVVPLYNTDVRLE